MQLQSKLDIISQRWCKMIFKTTINKENIKEITRTSFKSFYTFIKICTIYVIFGSILVSLFYLHTEQNLGKALFFIFYAIIFPIAMVLVLKYAVKIQIRRFNELSQNKNFIEYRYEFKDNNINILNRTTFSNINIRRYFIARTVSEDILITGWSILFEITTCTRV